MDDIAMLLLWVISQPADPRRALRRIEYQAFKQDQGRGTSAAGF
jgi:hypothetical protein